LIKVDKGVGYDFRTWIANLIVDGTIFTLSDLDEGHHVRVVSGHEFDVHTFPEGSGDGVSLPGNIASRAFVVNVLRGWSSRGNVCTHKERCGKNKKRDERLCGEHFLFVF